MSIEDEKIHDIRQQLATEQAAAMKNPVDASGGVRAGAAIGVAIISEREVKKQPSVEAIANLVCAKLDMKPLSSWIPCAERLPEENQPPYPTYWVTVEIGGKRIVQEAYFDTEFGGYSPQGKLIAWYSKPIMPAPYEGE